MKGTILLVEDESGENLIKLLELSDYYVILYQRGREAIEDVKEGLRYRLALVDLSLPDVGGMM